MIKSAFNQTIDHYGFVAKQLSDLSGVSPNHISGFRRGINDVSTKKLEDLLEAMDSLQPGASQYFWLQLVGASLEFSALEARIMVADRRQLTKLLRMVTDRWETLDNSSSDRTDVSAELLAV